jgi:hypothetical protein
MSLISFPYLLIEPTLEHDLYAVLFVDDVDMLNSLSKACPLRFLFVLRSLQSSPLACSADSGLGQSLQLLPVFAALAPVCGLT